MTHTRSEILAMTPEQLRIEIARRMGWEDIFEENIRLIGSYRGPFGRMCPIPDYPNDINAAWELIEEAIMQEFYITIEITPFISKYWKVHLGNYYAKAETVPLAICQAWLIWKGEGENANH